MDEMFRDCLVNIKRNVFATEAAMARQMRDYFYSVDQDLSGGGDCPLMQLQPFLDLVKIAKEYAGPRSRKLD